MRLLHINEWNRFFAEIENPHILQTYEWGVLKSHFGWLPFRIEHNGQIAQVLLRQLPFGYKIAYLPRSSVDLKNHSFWKEIDIFCRSKKTIFLKFEPDNFIESSHFVEINNKFIKSISIQPRKTIEIDLAGNEDDWLERMKPKTRYNIRLAIKKKIKVELSDDITTFYGLMLDTSNRDKFGVHSKEYYQFAYDLFNATNNVALFMAYYEGTPLAGLMVYRLGNRSWYFYGASNNTERNRMPTYLLQFEAMKWAKAVGCDTYDLWGIPDESEDILERDFDKRSDGLWGVYRFKRGFGGTIRQSENAFDRVYHPLLYKVINLYQRIRGDVL
jgi:lipid II:glycine glycyltransferase (peptidoglycan interpeptide bridge formation enzyme)